MVTAGLKRETRILMPLTFAKWSSDEMLTSVAGETLK